MIQLVNVATFGKKLKEKARSFEASLPVDGSRQIFHMRAPKSHAEVEAKARAYARELLNKARRANTTVAERRCSVAEEVLGSECLELSMPRTNPSAAIQLLLQGLDFQRREKYEIAIQLFCKSILKNSNRQTFICGHICRGNLFYELAHYHEAERDFVRCIQADSRCAVAHLNRGLALKCMAAKVRGNVALRQERLDGAMAEIETAAALAAKARDKDGAKALESILRVRALMLRRQGDFFRAQEDYLQVHTSMGREHKPAGAEGPSASGAGARVSMVEELRDAAMAAMAATETSRNDPSRLVPVCEYLQTTRLFAELPPATLRACALRCRCESVETGTVMVQEGEDATAFLVLMEGTAEIKVATADEEVRIEKAAPGDMFGQRALIGGNAGKSIASVVVLSRPSAVFIVIDAEAFVESGLEAHFRAIFVRKLETLRQCVSFSALPEEELVELAHFTRFAVAERNTAIVEENAGASFVWLAFSMVSFTHCPTCGSLCDSDHPCSALLPLHRHEGLLPRGDGLAAAARRLRAAVRPHHARAPPVAQCAAHPHQGDGLGTAFHANARHAPRRPRSALSHADGALAERHRTAQWLGRVAAVANWRRRRGRGA